MFEHSNKSCPIRDNAPNQTHTEDTLNTTIKGENNETETNANRKQVKLDWFVLRLWVFYRALQGALSQKSLKMRCEWFYRFLLFFCLFEIHFSHFSFARRFTILSLAICQWIFCLPVYSHSSLQVCFAEVRYWITALLVRILQISSKCLYWQPKPGGSQFYKAFFEIFSRYSLLCVFCLLSRTAFELLHYLIHTSGLFITAGWIR